jgi:hypothetical protein
VNIANKREGIEADSTKQIGSLKAQKYPCAFDYHPNIVYENRYFS